MKRKCSYDLVMCEVTNDTAVYKHNVELHYDYYGPRAKVTMRKVDSELAQMRTAEQRQE